MNNMNKDNTNADGTKDNSNIYSVNSEELKPKSKSDIKCAPGITFEAGSCIRLHILVEMAKAYNKTASNEDTIKLSESLEVLNPKKYKRYLVSEFSKRMGDKCTTQKCWSSQDFIDNMKKSAQEELLKYTHRPDSPAGKYEWLNTFDINKVMEQYIKKYNGQNQVKTHFLGAVPIDFKELNQLEASHIDYHGLYKNGVRQLAIVFNLDRHDQPGSHWVALFADFSNLNSGKILFFDSYGIKPEKEIRVLMREISRFMIQIGIPIDKIKVDYNKLQHQKQGSECGVYSVWFLIKMIKTSGNDFDKYVKNRVSDEKINKCRAIYFDKYNNQL